MTIEMEISKDWLWENRGKIFEMYFKEEDIDEPVENIYRAYYAYREAEDIYDTVFFPTTKIDVMENDSESATNSLITLKMLIEILQERADYIEENIPLCEFTIEEYKEDKEYFVRLLNESQNLKKL